MAKRRPLRHSEARRRAEERAQRRSGAAGKGRPWVVVGAVFAVGLLAGVGLGVMLIQNDLLPPEARSLADRLAAAGGETAASSASEPTAPPAPDPSPEDPSGDEAAAAPPVTTPDAPPAEPQSSERTVEPEAVRLGDTAVATASAEPPDVEEVPVSSEVLDAESAISQALPAAPLPPELARSTEQEILSALDRAPLNPPQAVNRPSAAPPPSPQPRVGAVDRPAGQVHVVYEEVEKPAPAAGRPVNLAALVEQANSLPGTTAPAIRRDVRPVWLANAVPAGEAAGRPMIAIVFDDLGLNRPNARRIIALPGPLTLSFMTYANDLDGMTASARAAGHELMVHMPMEPIDQSLDAGRNVLSVTLDAEEVRRRLDWGLGRFSGYVGINNHMGSRFTAHPSGMAVVMAELKRRGLLFLDSKTAVSSVSGRLADRLGVPFIERDIFIDNAPDDPESMRRQLARLETLALQRGAAVGIGHPHSSTIEVLSTWLAGLHDRGFVLVPISALVQRRIRLAEEGDSAG